jgi:hypothetical protein
MNIKVLFIVCLLLSQSIYAIQCPPLSDWTHIKGESWKLSYQAEKQGWQAITYEGAIDSDLTQIPQDAPLLIGVSQTVHRFTTCGYTLKSGNTSSVIAALNTKDAVDIKKLKPPFGCRKGRCFCHTTAAQPEICSWEWKN